MDEFFLRAPQAQKLDHPNLHSLEELNLSWGVGERGWYTSPIVKDGLVLLYLLPLIGRPDYSIINVGIKYYGVRLECYV